MHALRKWRALGVAFAITLTAGLALAQQSSVGGLSSRLRLTSLGVGQAAPAGTGNITATGTVTATNFVGTVGGIATNDLARLSQSNIFTGAPQTISSAGTAAVRVAGNGTTPGSTSFDLIQDNIAAYVWQRANLPLLIGTNGTTRVTIAADGSSINVAATAVQTNGVDITATTTSATGTATGCTTAPTATFRYTRNGNMAVMHIDSTGAACTSNATTFTFTSAVPVGFRPTRQHECVLGATNNSVNEFAIGLISNSATFTLARLSGASGWTNSGTKAVDVGATCSYLMQ